MDLVVRQNDWQPLKALGTLHLPDLTWFQVQHLAVEKNQRVQCLVLRPSPSDVVCRGTQ